MTDVPALLTPVRALLLDFDGPVCSIFANHSAPGVAETLRQFLASRSTALPENILTADDPLEILRWSAGLHQPGLLHEVENLLCREEEKAAASADPTPFAREVIVAAHEQGVTIVIVSNNSAPAIRLYFDRERLSQHLSGIIGRAHGRPDLMKPSREPMLQAMAWAGPNPADYVLVGDSITDVEAAHNVGMPAIALANRPSKVPQFREAGAECIVISMEPIAAALMGDRS